MSSASCVILLRTGPRRKANRSRATTPDPNYSEFSEYMKTDLLVIGTHSKRGLEKMILGSFAEGVIHHANCPVCSAVGPHVKPPTESGLTFETIVFATDFQHSSVEKAAVALTLPRTAQPEFTCAMCWITRRTISSIRSTWSSRRKSRLSRLIPAAALEWCDPECLVDYGDVPEHILRLAQRVNASLIVLQGRGGTRHGELI